MVIAIIAVLAGMLLPALALAKKKTLFDDTNDVALARWNRDHQAYR